VHSASQKADSRLRKFYFPAAVFSFCRVFFALQKTALFTMGGCLALLDLTVLRYSGSLREKQLLYQGTLFCAWGGGYLQTLLLPPQKKG
jgi:hypothetical protein